MWVARKILDMLMWSGMALAMCGISTSTLLTAQEKERDIFLGVLRDRKSCAHPDALALIAKTAQELSDKLNAKKLETLQLLHASCGAYLKQHAPKEYTKGFTQTPQWATPEQWSAMIVDDRTFAFIVQSLRANIYAPEKFCSMAGSLGRHLEAITGHDIVRSLVCYLCESTFVKNKDTRARAAVCSANFFDAIASLVNEKDCEYIAYFGRGLKQLPGPLKNRVARICEPYFLGVKPLAEDVQHPQAWAAVTYKSLDDAFDQRHILLLKDTAYKKSLLESDDDEE